MNVYKPFYTSFTIPSASNVFTQYTVYSDIETWNADTQATHTEKTVLYKGRTWIDGDHKTNINLSEVLRDYAFKPSIIYNQSTQNYTVGGGCSWNTLTPIEQGGNLFNNRIEIVITNPSFNKNFANTETTKPTIETPVYNINSNPYNNNTDLILYNSLGTSILPEIPFVSTGNYFFGLFIGWDARFKDDTITVGNNGGFGDTIQVQLNKQWGNYFITQSLSGLYTAIGDTLRNDVYLYFTEGGTPHPVPIAKKIATVNRCPYDYYIAWLTPWGSWQSQGFDGRKALQSEDVKQETLTDLNDATRVYQMENTFKYTLNRTCKRDLYNLLSTVALSPCVYLYDVKNDTGHAVNCTNGNVSSYQNGRINEINLEFENIQKYTV